MQTKEWKIDSLKQIDKSLIKEATHLLSEGEVLAFPTETVYGLGADAKNEAAVRKIFQAKGRPAGNPLIAHVSSQAMLESLILEKPAYLDQLIKAFSPGPLTYVLKSKGSCAEAVTAGLDTLALRLPDHPVALALIEDFNGPIAAPSANLSGRPSPVRADQVHRDLYGRISGIIDAGPTGIGLESTVLDCTADSPVILRPGAITSEEIQAVLKDLQIKTEGQSRSDQYKHYKPEVPLYLVKLPKEGIRQVIEQEGLRGNRIGLLGSKQFTEQFPAVKSFSLGEDLKDIARNLYTGFRHFNKETVDIILCQAFPEEGLGKTIMNRIERAAEKVIQN